MRFTAMAAAVAALLAAAPLALAATDDAMGDRVAYYGKQKVVYHLNQQGGDKDAAYMAALTNVQNHINAVGKDNVEVRIVMHGDGVGLVKDAKENMNLQAKVTNLKDQKVGFLVCDNTLKGRKIDPDKDLFDVDRADIVPSGVAELSRLQQQGYTYIRP